MDKKYELLKMTYENRRLGFLYLVIITVTIGLALINKIENSRFLIIALFILFLFFFYITFKAFNLLETAFIKIEEKLK